MVSLCTWYLLFALNIIIYPSGYFHCYEESDPPNGFWNWLIVYLRITGMDSHYGWYSYSHNLGIQTLKGTVDLEFLADLISH